MLLKVVLTICYGCGRAVYRESHVCLFCGRPIMHQTTPELEPEEEEPEPIAA